MRLYAYAEVKAYFQGKRDGIWLFAWWKDGEQYCGTSGKKLSEVEKEIIREEQQSIDLIDSGEVAVIE